MMSFRILSTVEHELRKLGTLSWRKRLLNKADIEEKVQKLKDVLSEAYTSFGVSFLGHLSKDAGVSSDREPH